jgi:hypothetical protein
MAQSADSVAVNTITEDGTFIWPEWINVAIVILTIVVGGIKVFKPTLFDKIMTGGLVAKAEAVFNVGRVFLQSIDKDSEDGVAISSAEKERLRIAIEDIGKKLGKT